ncbi:MAG: plastocyanin/azurin family copper-binding protein [Acidimicrobiia bacterium]
MVRFSLRFPLVVTAIVASALASFSACAPVATVPPNGESVTVQVLDNSFRPIDFEIAAGTEVVFDNRGRNEHNVLPETVKSDADLVQLLARDTSPSAWGVASTDFAPGENFSHVFTAPGVYPFYCSIHGVPGVGMYGVIRVS